MSRIYGMARQCETLCGFLAEMGYVAFTFDFCGGSAMCGKSDGKTTEMSVPVSYTHLDVYKRQVM